MFLWHTDDSIRACSAYFTFVSLDEKRRPQAIPFLELHTEEEARRFEAGNKRYQKRKERREGQSWMMGFGGQVINQGHD